MKKIIFLLFTIAATWSAMAQVPTSGLVEYFTFDSTLTGRNGISLSSGGVANYVANRQTQTNKAHFVAASANALGNVFAIGLTGAPSGNANRTVSLWFKSNANAIHSLFNYTDNPTTTAFAIGYDNGKIIASNYNQNIQANFTYNTNWNHVVVVHNAGTTSIYINNVLVNSGTITYSTPANPIVRIGGSPSGSYYGNFSIDDVAIYSRAMTAQGVDTLFNATCFKDSTPTFTANPVMTNVCSGNSTTLTATGSNLNWFDVAVGGSPLASGNSYSTPPITVKDTFYVQSGTGVCASDRIPIVVKPLSATPVIRFSNDTIKSTNSGYNNYKLLLNGVVVDSSNSTGNINYKIPSNACGPYQAKFAKVESTCPNRTFSIYRFASPCYGYIDLIGVAEPFRWDAGTSPVGSGLPSNSQNGGNIPLPGTCIVGTRVYYNIQLEDGCRYTNDGKIMNSPTNYLAGSSNNTIVNCDIFSNSISTPNTPSIGSVTASFDTTCAGSTTSITANISGGNFTYLWSNGGQSPTNPVSPIATTTYTVTVTSFPSGCTATASKTINVKALPTAAITAADSICPGTSTLLTASGGGTYDWSNTLGSGATKTVSPTANTTYTVTVTGANGCINTASKTVALSPAAFAGFGQSTFDACNGASVTLTGYTNQNPVGTTFAWSTGQSGAIVSVTPAVSPATTYSLTVTTPKGCTATESRSVNIFSVTAAISGPTTTCAGTSATLTVSGGTTPNTYVWSNSLGIGTSKTVTPTQTTTYTVTVTGAGNCTVAVSQTVSVQSAPTATITGATSVCSGANVTLTANGGNTYTWANNLGGNAAITVTPTQTTTYTVTVSIGANCTASATKTLTVKQPTASTRNQTICQGSSYTFKGQTLRTAGTYRDTILNVAGCDSVITLALTVTPAIQRQMSQTICKGSSYTFKGQNLSAAGTYRDTTQTSAGCDSITILSLVVTPAIQRQLSQSICFGASFTFNGQTLTQAGTYRDTTQTTAGCDSITILTLNVRNRATQTINAQLCTGQSYSFKGQSLTQSGTYLDTVQTTAGCDSFITLNLSVNSFVTGTTTKAICQGESFTFNGQSITQAGQYLDTLVSVGGCDSILTLTLTVNPLPTPTISKTGASLSTQTFASYQWKLNGSNISSATNQTYTATTNGSYTVEVIDANGCKNTSSAAQVTGLSIDNTRLSDIRFEIYPNPASEVLNIEVEANQFTLTVTDIAGRKMMITENQKVITLNALASGVYTIEIKTTNGIARKQFIKK